MNNYNSHALLGCIADDFTGATDLANMLVRGGMRTLQTVGVPSENSSTKLDADAFVVALKSRTLPVAQAIELSLHALRWLRAKGCQQFFFKYCSTFDSTPDGNIGPVAEALMAELDNEFTVFCPAFPEAGRTVFRGHLFVHDSLLNESGMEHHPLTPMRDANLLRVLRAQSRNLVGLIRYDIVGAGPAEVIREFEDLKNAGIRLAIADAVSDEDLCTLGRACADFTLVTGGSGLALGLPENFRRKGLLREGEAAVVPAFCGPAVILAGSASKATNGQVAEWLRADRPALRLNPLNLAAGQPIVQQAIAFALQSSEPVLIYATSGPEEVESIQAQLGVHQSGELVETALGDIARGLLDAGIRRFVVAGGETSGAVVQALGIEALQIGRQIDPGVPVALAIGKGESFSIALKSGNFGSIDFFDKALRRLAGDWT